MMEWGAMLLVMLQLELVRQRELYWSWAVCLLACCLWAGVAYDREMWGLMSQQFVIMIMAVRGFLKERPKRAPRAPHADHRSGRQPDDDYGGNGG